MQSPHCQARVNGSVKGIEDVEIEKLEAGKLFISVQSNDVLEMLVETVEKAGYKVEAITEKNI